MKEELQKWNLDTLAEHSISMFNSLIYDHNITSETLKEIDFEDINGVPIAPTRGYFASKDKKKYWINESMISKLPLKLGDEFDELKYKEDLIFYPLNPKVFKITPEYKINIRRLIDDFLPFEHTNIEHWNLLKFCAIAGFVSRIYLCVSSPSEFGKSSIFDVLHYLTDKSPVFKPRSVPGMLNQINTNGNIILDEAHQCKKEVRDIMEEFALQIGAGKALYINGAMKAKNTKSRYDCSLQSMTFLYNDTGNYDNIKDYFEFIFSNNEAIDTRFLKLKFEGKLTQKFDKNFNIPQVAEETKGYYIDFAKTLLYLQEVKRNNEYQKRWNDNQCLPLEGRRAIIYNEILWLVDMYANDQEEYDKWVRILNGCITEYKLMVKQIEGFRYEGKEETIVGDIDD